MKPYEEAMSVYGSPVEVASHFWDKLVPIAAALGLRFEWERTGEGQHLIQVRQ